MAITIIRPTEQERKTISAHYLINKAGVSSKYLIMIREVFPYLDKDAKELATKIVMNRLIFKYLIRDVETLNKIVAESEHINEHHPLYARAFKTIKVDDCIEVYRLLEVFEEYADK